MEKVPMTAEGHAALDTELKRLKSVERPTVIQAIAEARTHGDLFLGASPRASLAIMKAAKALAAMSGREFVTPDDIRFVTAPVLNHRIILSPEKEMEGVEIEDVINSVVQSIEVPR